MTKRLIGLIVVALSAAVLTMLLRDQEPEAPEKPPSIIETEAVSSFRLEPAKPSGPKKKPVVIVPAEKGVQNREIEPTIVVEEISRVSTNELRALLPSWTEYQGVDLHREQITIAGQSVTRARGRFEWPNGSRMEIEVSDLGSAPDDALLKSLGFNVDAVPEEDAESLPQLDVPHSVTRQEYDEMNSEGFVQLLVEDRFLVEVQLQKLPFESFRTIVEFQIPFQTLIDLASEQAP